jgi:hypothetical protein
LPPLEVAGKHSIKRAYRAIASAYTKRGGTVDIVALSGSFTVHIAPLAVARKHTIKRAYIAIASAYTRRGGIL